MLNGYPGLAGGFPILALEALTGDSVHAFCYSAEKARWQARARSPCALAYALCTSRGFSFLGPPLCCSFAPFIRSHLLTANNCSLVGLYVNLTVSCVLL